MRAVVAVTVALMLAGCVEAVRPTPVQLERAQAQGIAPQSIEAGRALFVTRCTACHVAPDPMTRMPSGWPGAVDTMAARASLTPAQEHLIVQYLQVVSEP